jgi:hypothetical protein
MNLLKACFDANNCTGYVGISSTLMVDVWLQDQKEKSFRKMPSDRTVSGVSNSNTRVIFNGGTDKGKASSPFEAHRDWRVCFPVRID